MLFDQEDYFLKELQVIDLICARAALGAMRTTPAYFLYHDLDLPTPKIRTQAKLMSFVGRSLSKPEHHPLYRFVQQAQSTNPKAHHNIYHRFFQHDLGRQFEDIAIQLPVDPTTRLVPPTNFITINQKDKDLAITNTKCLKSSQEHLIVYTDGSRVPDHRSAAAAWCENSDTTLSAQLGQARLFGNYTAEYQALHLGLNLVLQHSTGATKRASLILDNQGVVLDMTSQKTPITSLLDRKKAYTILKYIQQAFPSL